MSQAADEILGLKTAVMPRWAKGDPSRFLEISNESVTYIDPFQAKHRNLEFLESLRLDRYDSFPSGSDGEMRWHGAGVYRHTPKGWRIVHTHPSFPKAGI